MIVALDVDGTLLTHEWPDLGKDIGAFEWLLRFQEQYSELKYMLWTVRSGEQLLAITRYCEHRRLKLWSVNVNPDQVHWSPSNKAHAHVYVDDAAIGTPLIYPTILSGISKPYIDWHKLGPMLGERIAAYHMKGT